MSSGKGYGSLDALVPPKVIDSRRAMRIVLELDAPDEDYGRVVIPGSREEPPTVLLELMEGKIRDAFEKALHEVGADMEILTLRTRLGAVHEYTKHDPF